MGRHVVEDHHKSLGKMSSNLVKLAAGSLSQGWFESQQLRHDSLGMRFFLLLANPRSIKRKRLSTKTEVYAILTTLSSLLDEK